MANLPRFLIADNGMAEPGQEYVIHTQLPRFIAKRIFESPSSSFEIIDDIDNMLLFFNGDAQKIAGLMRRLGDWYVAYCEWEENQNYDDEDEDNG